jgi:hypothetical protein
MKYVFLIIFIFLPWFTFAQVNPHSMYQKGYVKKSTGTYVQPHFKTQTNKTNHDNYSTKPNTNTYTGSKGTKARDYSPDAYNYGKGHSISTGLKGGQYYKNSKGNKVYVPKRK